MDNTTTWRARRMYWGRENCFTPYISAGDTARVLCFMNLSGAYGGYAGQEEAEKDARTMAAAQDLRGALECVQALGMDPEEGERIIAKHGGPEAPEFSEEPEDADPVREQIEMRDHEKRVRAWVDAKVAAALRRAEEG
jgi:hypothetical protein